MEEIKEQIKMQFVDGWKYVKLFGVKRLVLVCFLQMLVIALAVVLFKIFNIK